ncbi:aromatic amino acid lyase [Streptomyces tricolor]|nr:aromatic amino acid lyase [Streptomyces tricolor]
MPAPVTLRAGDALALLSSNALALAQAALAGHETEVLLRATHAVAALSLAAVSGSPEAYAAPVHALRPYPGPARAAAEAAAPARPARPSSPGPCRRTAGSRTRAASARSPQVHGAALDASAALRRIVEVEINCPTENPVLTSDGRLHHHGGFFAAPARPGPGRPEPGPAEDRAALRRAPVRAEPPRPHRAARLPRHRPGRQLRHDDPGVHRQLGARRAAFVCRGTGLGRARRTLPRAGGGRRLRRTGGPPDGTRRHRLRHRPRLRTRRRRPGVAPPPRTTGRPGLLPSPPPHSPADPEDRPLTGDIATATELLPRLAEL